MITLAFPVSGKSFWSFLLGISFLFAILLSTPTAIAQTQQQPFLFASTSVDGQEAVVTFLRDETSGVLTLLPAAPILFTHQCLSEAIDQQTPPQFLFGVCANGVAMYTFDPVSGAVTPGSPYTASTTGNSVYAVTEATGQFVYLIKITEPDVNGNLQFILEQFQITRGSAPALIPINSQTLPYLGQLGGIYPHANSHGIAIYTTVNETNAAPPTQTPTLFLITLIRSRVSPALQRWEPPSRDLTRARLRAAREGIRLWWAAPTVPFWNRLPLALSPFCTFPPPRLR